jgi:hypothetical protein
LFSDHRQHLCEYARYPENRWRLDDLNVMSCAGLVAVTALTNRCGLHRRSI